MAGANNEEQSQPALHAKRKTDPSTGDDPSKKQKKEISDRSCPPTEEKAIDAEAGPVPDEDYDEHEEQYYEVDDDDDDGDDDEDDGDDDEDEEVGGDDDHSNGKKPEVDRKGKGILREDKGKGKLVEEDDTSDGASQSDCASDLSDDPLAEVDLNNILPSRTRRRPLQPGLYLSNDTGDDGDDSDDSDA